MAVDIDKGWETRVLHGRSIAAKAEAKSEGAEYSGVWRMGKDDFPSGIRPPKPAEILQLRLTFPPSLW